MGMRNYKQSCKCQNCGNEAEMVITCSLPENSAQTEVPRIVSSDEAQIKGEAVCSACGNESEIWLAGIVSL
ncbi:MAG: hypothetical protein C4519_26475 [Desulfobacteraceae bacterium]|nr:MAG: hypothetical protein C4519_26475 [Desulfobacteraceae bacterium]